MEPVKIADARARYDASQQNTDNGDQTPPLRAAMIGLANDVSEALSMARMPGNHRALLELVRRYSHGNAGYQRKSGYADPGAECTFHLALWAQQLGWNKSYLLRVRDRLVADHVLTFTPDPAEPGCGTIAINLTFKDWLPLDRNHTNALYRRPGAGRKPITPSQQPDIDNQITAAAEHRQPDCEYASGRRQSDYNSLIPMSTLASCEVAADTGAASPIRNSKKKDQKEDLLSKVAPAQGEVASFVGAPRTASPDTPLIPSSQPVSSKPTPAPVPALTPVQKPAKTSKQFAPESEPITLALYLRNAILANLPTARDARAAEPGTAKLQNWAIPIDLMLRIDKRTPEGIRAIIDFVQHDSFWCTNILSPSKLRDQYDRLDAERQRKAKRKPVPPRADRDRAPEVRLDRMPTF